MTSKLRQTRRTTSRTPAIWRGRLAREVEHAPASAPQAVRGRLSIPWRLVSGLIVLSLLMVLALFFTSDAFYVHSIAVGGMRTMSSSEIFALTNVTGMHIFWVEPEQVRKDILRSPTLADAQVSIGWPPNMVQIVITEREPALVWEQAGTATWIDLQGRVMRQREDRPGLLRVSSDEPGGIGVSVDPNVVTGAVQLQALLPDVTVLRYHPDKGLGYNDQRGWQAWFGTGANMREKVLVYNAMVTNFQNQGYFLREFNIVNPDAPVLCCKDAN